MFGATDELMVLGVGAARDGDREQARFYLEWALRDDLASEQVAEAWYWLSRVADDPVERRRCLGNALGANLHHPEARRDLALLDGRLRTEELTDSRQELAPLTLAHDVASGEIRRYRCDNCGGALSFDAALGRLRCQFCGHDDVPDRANDSVDEQDWAVAAFSRRGHRWVLPTERTVACEACGATAVMPPGLALGQCGFCGSSRVVLAHEAPDLIRPEAVATFAFDVAAARRHAHRWLCDQPLRPRDLPDRAVLDTPRPVYAPFWTFDIEGEVAWRGDVERQNVRIPRSGTEHHFHDDALVPAGRSLPAALLSDVRSDPPTLVPYTPDLLVGWPVELYSVPPTDASLLARERVLHECRETFRVDDAGEEIHDLTINGASVHVLSFKLILLPLWIADYRYGETRYRLIIDGRSGAGHGDVPRGRLQGWLARALDW